MTCFALFWWRVVVEVFMCVLTSVLVLSQESYRTAECPADCDQVTVLRCSFSRKYFGVMVLPHVVTESCTLPARTGKPHRLRARACVFLRHDIV